MILGIGTDIVSIPRMRDLLGRFGERLVVRLLHPKEREAYVLAVCPAAFLSKRFAAKEALVKAMGSGFRDGLRFNQIQVSHTDLGAPLFLLQDRALEWWHSKQRPNLWLSVSDEKKIAMAFVVVEA